MLRLMVQPRILSALLNDELLVSVLDRGVGRTSGREPQAVMHFV
jgi:hypothetical protein